MDLHNAWTVAEKDFKIFRKKNVIYSTVLFPLFVVIGLPLVVRYARAKSGGIPVNVLPGLLNVFSFFFIIGVATLTTAIASYSLVGEKVQKSMEPLLATPVADGEILLGKTISAFLPPIAAIYGGAALFMALIDQETYSRLTYLYLPNWTMGIILLLVAPLSSLLCVELNVIMSARMNDIRPVQQLGGVIVIPFMGIYLAAELGFLSLDTNNLFIISAGLLVVDVILFYISKATFRREEILTKWK